MRCNLNFITLYSYCYALYFGFIRGVKVSDYSYSFGLLVLGCAAIPIPSLDLELVLIVHIFSMVPNFPPCFNLVG